MNPTHKSSLATGEMAPPANADVLRWTKWWLSVLTILTLGLLVGFGLHFLQGRKPQPADRGAAPETSSPSSAANSSETLEGPWGRLEIVPITIRPPMEFVWQAGRENPGVVTWYFPHTSLSQLNDKLIQLGLPDSLQDTLRSLAKLDPAIDGYTVSPDRELVMGLHPEVRAKLYGFLHRFRENRDQTEAFRFCGASAQQWFGDSPIMPETKQLVTPLIYRLGSFLFFADLPSIEPLLPSAQERKALIRALSRESTMLLKLKVSAESDIEALVDYWGRGGRDQDVRPILESLSRLGGEQDLDVTQLLPPFARQRIYTYPTPRADDDTVNRDCYWTAMNFFCEQPDDQFSSVEKVSQALQDRYYRIHGNPQLGDLVFFVDHQQEPVHAAVYIAADILFTKNGSTTARPWMFLKMEDMKHFYPRTNKKEVTFFRPKAL